MISLALRFSAIFALVLTIAGYTIHESIIRENNVLSNIANMGYYAAMIVILFFGMKSIRSSVYKNEITYGQSLYSGMMIAFFGAIGIGITTLIYFQFIRPDYPILLSGVIQKTMTETNASAADIQKELAMVKSTTVLGASGAAIFNTMLLSAIFCCVLAAFVRTKDTFTAEQSFK